MCCSRWSWSLATIYGLVVRRAAACLTTRLGTKHIIIRQNTCYLRFCPAQQCMQRSAPTACVPHSCTCLAWLTCQTLKNISALHIHTCRLQSPDKLQLLREVREASGQWLPLDDAKKLAELKVENDDVLALAYAQEGERQQQQERQQIACAGRAESAGGRQGSGNSSSSSSRADRAGVAGCCGLEAAYGRQSLLFCWGVAARCVKQNSTTHVVTAHHATQSSCFNRALHGQA